MFGILSVECPQHVVLQTTHSMRIDTLVELRKALSVEIFSRKFHPTRKHPVELHVVMLPQGIFIVNVK